MTRRGAFIKKEQLGDEAVLTVMPTVARMNYWIRTLKKLVSRYVI